MVLRLASAALAALCLTAAVVRAAPAERDRDGGPRLSARAVLVIDDRSGRVLLSRSSDELRSIGSLTKMMGALVFIDRGLKLAEGTEINRDDWRVALDGCRTRLELKWTYRNSDLLHAALMASDNRAVSALARAVGLSPNALVQAMNERARRMGLKHTQFIGPVGIEPGNVSTAREMARVVREVSRQKVLRSIMGKAEYQVKPMRGYLKVAYRNSNTMVGTKGLHFLASKTGFNHKAGYCLASVVESGDIGRLTVVLLGCKRKPERTIDLGRILRWLRAGGRQKTV
jgi:D-alanyl-D-alanine endopeptidase (penicillin-binding protein 7)